MRHSMAPFLHGSDLQVLKLTGFHLALCLRQQWTKILGVFVDNIKCFVCVCVCVCVWIIWGSKNLIFRLPSNEREQPKAFSLLAGCFGLDSRSICDGVRHMLLKFRKFADQDCRTSNAKNASLNKLCWNTMNSNTVIHVCLWPFEFYRLQHWMVRPI